MIQGHKLLKMMKNRVILTLIAVVVILTSIGVCAATLKSEAAVDGEQELAVQTPMDLFLGMGYDENYSYSGNDSLLYWFPGLIMQEKAATWYQDEDDYAMKFRCSLGLYIDKEYPSEVVFRKLEAAIDSAVVFGLELYGGMDNQPAFRLREANTPQNAQQILDFGSQVFDMYTNQMKARKPVTAYEQAPEARWCLVVHKVYDKGDQATYIFETSYDINGSCGCPSAAHFFTYDKATGRIMRPDDVIGKYGVENLKSQLWSAYKEAREERGFTDEDGLEVSRDELLTEADGCALVNEGLLFYYLPYHIGCGAEGEYFLIVGL